MSAPYMYARLQGKRPEGASYRFPERTGTGKKPEKPENRKKPGKPDPKKLEKHRKIKFWTGKNRKNRIKPENRNRKNPHRILVCNSYGRGGARQMVSFQIQLWCTEHSFLIVDLRKFPKNGFFTKRLQNGPPDLSRPPSGAKFRDLADDRRQKN